MALAMGVTKSRVSRIEGAARLEERTVLRYLDALVTCGTVRTSARPAA